MENIKHIIVNEETIAEHGLDWTNELNPVSKAERFKEMWWLEKDDEHYSDGTIIAAVLRKDDTLVCYKPYEHLFKDNYIISEVYEY